MGLLCVLPWGSPDERARSERLAKQMNHAITPPRLNLTQTASLLASSRLVIGVDTGLSHLAAALKIPLVALYGATDPGLTGVLSSGSSRNLGSKQAFPAVDEVLAACHSVLPA
jgi:heptosyltransferase-1